MAQGMLSLTSLRPFFGAPHHAALCNMYVPCVHSCPVVGSGGLGCDMLAVLSFADPKKYKEYLSQLSK